MILCLYSLGTYDRHVFHLSIDSVFHLYLCENNFMFIKIEFVAGAGLAMLQTFWSHSCVALKLVQLMGFKQHIYTS